MDREYFLKCIKSLENSSNESRNEMEFEIISYFKDIYSLNTILDLVLDSTLDNSCLQYSVSLIFKVIKNNWDLCDVEGKKSLLKVINPITFVNHPFFNQFLDKFIELSSFEDYYDLWHDIFNSSVSIINDSNHSVNLIHILESSIIYFLSENIFLDLEVINNLVVFANSILLNDHYLNIPNEYFVSILRLRHEILFNAIFRKRYDVDNSVPEIFFDSFLNDLELFLHIIEQLTLIENLSVSQSAFILWLCDSVLRLIRCEEDVMVLSESIGEFLTLLSYRLWILAKQVSLDKNQRFLMSVLFHLFCNMLDFLEFDINDMSYLVSLVSLTQEDKEDFLNQPIIFFNNCFCPGPSVEYGLRNIVLYFFKKISNELGIDEIESIINMFCISEEWMTVLSRLSRAIINNGESLPALQYICTLIMDQDLDMYSELGLLYLLSSTITLFSKDESFLMVNILFEKISERPIPFSILFCKLLKKYDSLIQNIDVSLVLPLIEMYDPSIPSSHFIQLLLNVSSNNPRIVETFIPLIEPLSLALTQEIGETGSCDGIDVSIYWSHNAILLLTRIANVLDGSSSQEPLFSMFQNAFSLPEFEPLSELLYLTYIIVSHRSLLSHHYFVTIISSLSSSLMMWGFLSDCAPIILCYLKESVNECQEVYNCIVNCLRVYGLPTVDSSIYAVGAIISHILLLEETLPNDYFQLIINVLLDSTSNVQISMLSAFNIIAAHSITRNCSLDPKILHMWQDLFANTSFCHEKEIAFHIYVISQVFNEQHPIYKYVYMNEDEINHCINPLYYELDGTMQLMINEVSYPPFSQPLIVL